MKTVYVLQDQNFFELALPVFLGALAAFLLSMIAFLIRGRMTLKSNERTMLDNLSRELRYDIALLDDLKKELTNTLPKIISGQANPYVKIRYSKFLSVFIQNAYSSGVLFKILSEYDLSTFDEALSNYGTDSRAEAWIKSKIEDMANTDAGRQEVVSSIQYEINEIETHSRVFEDVITKINDYRKIKNHTK